MKRTTALVVLALSTLSTAAFSKGPVRPTQEQLERERAAAAAAAVDAERARVAAEAEAAKAKAEAEAKAKVDAEYVTVRVDSNYEYVRFEPTAAEQKTVFCGSPCVVKLHVGTSYQALAPGMLVSRPITVGEKTRSIAVHGSSRARHDGGLAATAIGILGMGVGGLLIEEGAKTDEYSTGTQMDLLISGSITAGIGLAFGVTGLVLMSGGTKAEAGTTPAAASVQASKPRLLPNGTFVF